MILVVSGMVSKTPYVNTGEPKLPIGLAILSSLWAALCSGLPLPVIPRSPLTKIVEYGRRERPTWPKPSSSSTRLGPAIPPHQGAHTCVDASQVQVLGVMNDVVDPEGVPNHAFNCQSPLICRPPISYVYMYIQSFLIRSFKQIMVWVVNGGDK